MSTTFPVHPVRRVIAVTLTILFALALTPATAAGVTAGGIEDDCGHGYWLKYDWTAAAWEVGPAWDDDDQPVPPTLSGMLWDGDLPTYLTWWSIDLTKPVQMGSVRSSDGGGVLSISQWSPNQAGWAQGERNVDASGLTSYSPIEQVVFCYEQPEPEGVDVRITTMCEYDGSMVLQLQREDTNTDVPSVDVGVRKSGDVLATNPDRVSLTPGAVDFVTLGGGGMDGLSVALLGWSGDAAQVVNDRDDTANRNDKPCGVKVTLEKAWTDIDPYLDTGVQLIYTGPTYFDWGSGSPSSINYREAIYPGGMLYLPYGETFDVIEDDGPWVAESGLGTGLVVDAPTTPAELAAPATLTWTVTNTYVPPPPDVQLEKAWFDSADDDVPVAIFRQTDDGWVLSDDGPKGYVPATDFVQPDDFDLTVEYGQDTYTVTETVPAGWEPMACGADAPMPNGLGDFPYERPDDGNHDVARVVETSQPDGLRHTVCNVRVPDPLVPDVELTKTPDVATVTYDPGDGDDETVTYTYVVTNTGETALTGLTLVDDVLGTILLPAGTLAPGATLNVDAVHVVDADDAAATTIVNTATATGTAPDETLATDTATARVAVETVPAAPSISLTKTPLVELDDDGDPMVVWSPDAPDATTITYEYVVTNTGDTPLGDITLVDDVLGAVPLPTTDLAVGASMTVTAVHTVTAGDAEAGQVDNEAVATGTAPNETDVSAEAAATVLVAEVRAGAVNSEVLSDTQEQLPAAGATTTVLALAAVAGIGLGGALLAVARRRQ